MLGPNFLLISGRQDPECEECGQPQPEQRSRGLGNAQQDRTTLTTDADRSGEFAIIRLGDRRTFEIKSDPLWHRHATAAAYRTCAVVEHACTAFSPSFLAWSTACTTPAAWTQTFPHAAFCQMQDIHTPATARQPHAKVQNLGVIKLAWVIDAGPHRHAIPITWPFFYQMFTILGISQAAEEEQGGGGVEEAGGVGAGGGAGGSGGGGDPGAGPGPGGPGGSASWLGSVGAAFKGMRRLHMWGCSGQLRLGSAFFAGLAVCPKLSSFEIGASPSDEAGCQWVLDDDVVGNPGLLCGWLPRVTEVAVAYSGLAMVVLLAGLGPQLQVLGVCLQQLGESGPLGLLLPACTQLRRVGMSCLTDPLLGVLLRLPAITHVAVPGADRPAPAHRGPWRLAGAALLRGRPWQ